MMLIGPLDSTSNLAGQGRSLETFALIFKPPTGTDLGAGI